ncbi:hypothetical protein ACFL20_10680, partial [Spirochaetota bacterium]
TLWCGDVASIHKDHVVPQHCFCLQPISTFCFLKLKIASCFRNRSLAKSQCTSRSNYVEPSPLLKTRKGQFHNF